MKDTLRSLFKNRFGEFLLRKLVYGKPYGSRISRLVPNHYAYKKGSYRRVVRDTLVWQLDISDLMEWFVYYGFSESARNLLLSHVAPGMYVADVGANAGMVTLPLSQRVGVSGMVYSFEPMPETFAKLEHNVLNNRLSNVRLFPFALGSEPSVGSAAFKDEANSGTTAIMPADGKEDSDGIAIIKMDDLYDSGEIERIDLIKVDVEGYEHKVLLGARKVIEQWKPIFFLEFNSELIRRIGDEPANLIEFLLEAGYSITDASNQKPFDFDNQILYHADLLAIHKQG